MSILNIRKQEHVDNATIEFAITIYMDMYCCSSLPLKISML